MSEFQIPTQNFIFNQWVPGDSDEALIVLDKYRNTPLATLQMAGENQMETAIAGAVTVFSEFKSWSAGKRSEHLAKLAELLKAKRDFFIDLIVHEAGKPRSYAVNEFNRSVTTLQTAVSEALSFGGEVVPLDYGAGTGKTAFTRRFPVGVVAGITPFNFPLNLVMHKVAPALAVGCPIIIKPAPQAPLSAIVLAELIKEAGFPAGVCSVLTCPNAVAEKLVRDERVAILSFTGSDQVGWHLKSICGKKKVTLELGGNAAVIIDESADLEGVAKKVAIGSFIYAGQTCISAQRIYVHSAVFDDFIEELIEETKNLVTGDPENPDTLIGPIIDRGHLGRIESWVAEAISGGARLLCGGKVLSRENNLYAPTLLTNTAETMRVSSSEVFGPVSIVEKIESFEAGIAYANASKYGLQAGVFTNRLDHFNMAHEQLEVGAVIINNIPGFRVDSMPYGGVKDSGLGQEGIRYAMEEMTEGRLVVY